MSFSSLLGMKFIQIKDIGKGLEPIYLIQLLKNKQIGKKFPDEILSFVGIKLIQMEDLRKGKSQLILG